MQLLGCQVHLLAAEVLHSEADAAELDGVELLYFVVKLALGVLERPHDEPKPVN